MVMIIPNSLIVSLISPHPLLSSPEGKCFPSIAGTLSRTDPVQEVCWGSGREIAWRAGMGCWVSFRTVSSDHCSARGFFHVTLNLPFKPLCLNSPAIKWDSTFVCSCLECKLFMAEAVPCSCVHLLACLVLAVTAPAISLLMRENEHMSSSLCSGSASSSPLGLLSQQLHHGQEDRIWL